MSEIKAGDVVYLKSNGTFRMTVESIDLVNKHAHCVWFTKAGKQERGIVDFPALQKKRPSFSETEG